MAAFIPASVFVLTALASILPVDKQVNAAAGSGEVTFEGRLLRPDVDHIIDQLTHGARVLHINSVGGDGRAIISLAKFVSDNKIDVVVDNYCLSDCASILFPASRSPTLKSGAVLGFHNTLTSMALVAEIHHISPAAEEYSVYARGEHEIYRQNQVNPIWLILPHYLLGLKCYGTFDGRAENFFTETVVNLYLPTDRQLHEMGFRYAGHLPTSNIEIKRSLDTLTAHVGHVYQWRFGSDTVNLRVTPLVVENAISSMPQCEGK